MGHGFKVVDEITGKVIGGEKNKEEAKWTGIFFKNAVDGGLGFDSWYAVVEPWLSSQEQPVSVVEIGSGRFSTPYFANHPKVSRVVSLEADPKWFLEVQKAVEGMPKATLIQCFKNSKPAGDDGEFEEFLRAEKEHGPFDMALIDGTSRGRNECLDEILRRRLARVSFFHDFLDAIGFGNTPHHYEMYGAACVRVKWTWPTTAIFTEFELLQDTVNRITRNCVPIFARLNEWLLENSGVNFPTFQYYESIIGAIRSGNPLHCMFLWQEVPLSALDKAIRNGKDLSHSGSARG